MKSWVYIVAQQKTLILNKCFFSFIFDYLDEIYYFLVL
jgi:hypothetical protein